MNQATNGAEHPQPITDQSTHGYYRFPTIHGDTVVFTAEGDLWRVSAAGGVAQRLTTHHGTESHPAISPDGTTLAFSAQYEGPIEVYTMPLTGGVPKRWTYEDGPALVVGWTPAGRILYSTRQYATLPNTQLATLDPQTGAHELVPLHQASDGVYKPDTQTLFFTRLPFQGSHTKRYQGGTAQNIWTFDPTNGDPPEAVPLTADYAGTSKTPMWWDGRVYFVSDRDGAMNLWSMDEAGGALMQHTFHKEWDVRSPSLHEGRIVYQLGADLHLFDIATNAERLIPITLASDFDQTRERWVDRPMSYLSARHVSPDGDRVVLTARGRVFVAPTKQGRLVEVTRQQGVRYRDARFLPDGKTILVLSDETGELEFWTAPANGVGEAQPLTDDGNVFRFAGEPSPDGQWIAYDDKDQQLWLVNIADKSATRIAASEHGHFYHLCWSPDSRWLAYVEIAANGYPQIKLYHLDGHPANGTTIEVTSDRVDSYSPAWSPDGKWLYFLSDRHFQSLVSSPWGPRQPEPYFDRTTKMYLVSLQAGARSPFRPADELHPAPPETKKENDDEEQPDETDSEPSDRHEEDVEAADSENGADASAEADADTDDTDDAADDDANGADAEKSVAVQIDLDGLQTRVMEAPVAPGNYANLALNDKHIFWTARIGDGKNRKTRLLVMEITNQDPAPKTLLDDIKRYELALDGKKLMVHKNNAIYVFDAKNDPPKDLKKEQVNLRHWTFAVNPRDEWRQIFLDAWRLERDYFYDRNLHGVDWPALRDLHFPLVERVRDRDELNDLIAQMMGELSALHTFVVAGDRRTGQDRVRLASLGATLIRDDGAGGYRIGHIYETDPDYPHKLAPLARPDLDVDEGDIIQAINGVPTLAIEHPALLLSNRAGQQVLLRVQSAATGESADHIVEPISASRAADLRYEEWEYRNRLHVEERSEGQIGYVHLRAMKGDDYADWARHYYPVFDRRGLIIDVRHNRGGNIDSWILEKLLRRAWFYWQPRVGQPYWSMQYAFRGHVVVLCNEFTASDGEAFAEGFRRLGLGPVIGTRTWGGEIWLSMNTGLVDKGIASAAQIGVYSPEGEWLIEGHGVDPDIVVDNLPHATFRGQDAQLDAALDHLLQQIAENPVDVPPPPPYPNKALRFDER